MERKIKNQRNSEETIDMFYGFWKYLGVVSIFLVGLALFWWGINIILSGAWVEARTIGGPAANIVLAPFAVGIALVWLSVAEFLRIIKNLG